MLLATLGPVAAQNTGWIGTGTGSWGDGANWSNGVPSSGQTAQLNNSGTAVAGADVSSLFSNLSMGTTSGSGGTLDVVGGYIYADTIGSSARLGAAAGGYGVVNVSSGTWRNADGVEVGFSGTGTVTVTGGQVLSGQTELGVLANSQGTVSMSSGTWNNSAGLVVGNSGAGSFTLSGGLMTTAGSGYSSAVGNQAGSNGTITISGGMWNNAGQMFIGASGTGAMVISSGTVINNRAILGGSVSGNGTVSVTGGDATWQNSENLQIGDLGSNNTVTVEDGGLVMVLGSLEVTSGNGNFIRLDDGYVAMWGSQISSINSLISNGNFQVWNGTAWVTSTNVNDFTFGYFATDAEALAFTGREGLGNYTIVSNAVPEPSTWALLGLGALMFGYTAARRRKPATRSAATC